MSLHQDLVRESLFFWIPSVEIYENYRPDWLYGLEVDFYLPKYRIAIEVQGRQHKYWTPDLQTYAEFQSQKNRDNSKRQICHKLGIKLIRLSHILKSIQKILNEVFVRRKIVPNKLPELPTGLKTQWKKYESTWAKLEKHRCQQTKTVRKSSWRAFCKARKAGNTKIKYSEIVDSKYSSVNDFSPQDIVDF